MCCFGYLEKNCIELFKTWSLFLVQQFSTTEVFCYADISGLIDNILQNVERKVFFAMENGHRLVEFSTRFYILWASFPITLASQAS